jgi:dTDP-4-dehydrorhamnose 3,5-epimerase
MPFAASPIEGVFVYSPQRHSDNRGHFEEQFKLSEFSSQVGVEFKVRQVNQSSSSKGVLRGIHYTEGSPGQAKYVSCPRGSVWDVAVDLRQHSPSYGKWFSEILSVDNGKSIFIPEGMGHAFVALEDDSVVNYLCSTEFDPSLDRALNPFSPKLAIKFDSLALSHGIESFVLSEKDSAAPDF